ncbi:MAG: DUF1559 domain-containing protein [Planctomyces sp.]|nr:DUF1559 domain-containing protein [Planctomyces sp.]
MIRVPRAGVTIIELMVALAVMAGLAAILIPAVQSARGTSRRLACSARLKEIGVASHALHSAIGRFPATGEAYRELHEAMGFPLDSSGNLPGFAPGFQCPADSWATGGGVSKNYVLNAGTMTRFADHVRNGYAPLLRERVATEISDGLSTTAAFSERLVIRYSSSAADVWAGPERHLWWTEPVPDETRANDPIALQRCVERRTSQLPLRLWLIDSSGRGYDHRITPNRPGCWVGAFPDAQPDDPLVPASSEHHGGVNVLFADGHVAFIADQIDVAVWRALGTINGGEPVEGNME